MRCDPRALSGFVSGVLPERERRRVAAHLAECDRCRSLADEYARIGLLIKELPAQQVPRSVELGLRRRLEQSEQGSGSVSPFRVVAAVAAMLVLAVGIAAALGRARDRTVDAQPAVMESEAQTQAPEAGGATVVRIVFDRPMDRGSVDQAIAISPPAPTEAPTWKEQGRVLEIPIKTDHATDYRVTVDGAARDDKGHALQQPYSMEFAIDPVGALASASRGTPTPTTRATTAPTATVSPAALAARPRVVAPREISDTVGGARTATATPSPTPTWQLAAGTISASGSPTPSQTVFISVTATPACPSVSGVLADVYAANPAVRKSLGCAVGPQTKVSAISQSFQHGAMLWRGDTRQVSVLFASGQWSGYPDTWKDGDPVVGAGTPPLTLYKPIRSFGKLWQDQPSLRDTLGWATEMEHDCSATVQSFARGGMLATDQGWVYALYSDGTWQRFRNNPN